MQWAPAGGPKSLFPYGKSGLKLREKPAGSLAAESLPVWEEWIEIRGVEEAQDTNGRLFPYGKSGLKWEGQAMSKRAADVSSRMGRVD